MNILQCGFADTIITPTLNGTFLDGYGHRMTPAESIRDDLHAKVCAMQTGNGFHLLFSIDLIGLNVRLYRLVTRQITALTGVPAERISLVFIHTHAAPAAGILDELPINYDYFGYVGELCGRAALRAMERACPGSFDFAILPEELTHTMNRRGRDFIDRRIRAAAFRDETGKLRGILCSAACHAVINTAMSISADWLSELNALSSDALPYLYLQGRGADINPICDNNSIDRCIEQLGRELSEPVKRFAEGSAAATTVEGELCSRYEAVRIPMMPMRSTDELRASIRACEDAYFSLPTDDINKHFQFRELQWLRHMLDLVERGESNDITVPLQLLSLGREFVFAFVPFELLTLTGNKLEELFARVGFERERIYICGYSNCINGYLAPAEEFPIGGYEVAGAAHWFNISQTCEASEQAVLDWFGRQAKAI